MRVKNKQIIVNGLRYDDKTGEIERIPLECIVTNDELGKSLSINDGRVQYTIAFEPLHKYLK